MAGTSRLTEWWPGFGGRLLDASLQPIVKSGVLATVFERRSAAVMARVQNFRRFLVIPDRHIGDAILAQSALTAIRDFFPDAVVDFVVNRTAAPVIEGNPEASRILPLFTGGRSLPASELAAVRRVIRKGHYDLCISLDAFVTPADFADDSQPFISIIAHGPAMLRNNCSRPASINHICVQEYRFVHELLSRVARPVSGEEFVGVETRYSDQAIAQAGEFVQSAGIGASTPVVMFNPDAASIYCMMPFEFQAPLLARIVRDAPRGTVVLVGEGHTAVGFGERLRRSLPPSLGAPVRIVPRHLPLDTYGAVIDRADLFASADTGPLHLAASRRVARSGRHRFRNRTAVLSWFGATVPRMSGYDSMQRGFLPSNQDAPSWSYQAGSRCRNITCLDKMMKTCRTVRCFEDVDVDGLAARVASHLHGGRRRVRELPLMGLTGRAAP